MYHLTKEKVLSTKEASDLSGYSADYLAKLTRAGKIKGERFGRSWVIEKSSLDAFMVEQAQRKERRSRALAQERERERQEGTLSTLAAHEPATPVMVARTLTTQLPMPSFGIPEVPARIHLVAFVIAFLVVSSGAFVANGSTVSDVGARTLSFVTSVTNGFYEEFGGIPSRIASRIETATPKLFEGHSSNQTSSDSITFKIGTQSLSYQPGVNLEEKLADMRFIIASVVESQGVPQAVGSANTGFSGDVRQPVQPFSVAALSDSVKTFVAALPATIYKGVIAVGDGTIRAAHGSIAAEVSMVYGVVHVAPLVSYRTFSMLESTGQVLADATAAVPGLSGRTFFALAQFPSHAAPVLASAVWSMEYQGAVRFVSFANTFSSGYLRSVEGIGGIAYTATHGVMVGAKEGISYASAVAGLFKVSTSQK